MATAATPIHLQERAENGDQDTEQLQSKRSSRRLSGLLSRHKSQRTEVDKGSEKPVKKVLEVPLYRRYASFRSRTPSARGGSTTPKSIGKDGMASTTEVETKNVAESGGAEQNASLDQAKKSETFPTTSVSKVEKPLPVPEDAPKRPRRISVKVSKILNSLPSPGKPKEDKVDSDVKAANEGTSRSRLLDRVGNIVNRKPKVRSKTNTEAVTGVEGAVADGPQETVVTEDGVAPVVPPKAEAEGVTEENREEAKPAEQPKTQEPSNPALISLKPPPPSAANRASRLARRLSSGALDAVRRSRSRTGAKGGAKAEALPASDASLVGQDPIPQPIQSEKPAVEGGEPSTNAPTISRVSTKDKVLPTPPADDTRSPMIKEKTPPTAFKDAARVARRLSNGASGIFKRPNASSPELSDTAKADSSVVAETRSVNDAPSATTTEKATELVRRISTRAQGAIAKARANAKAKNGGAQKPAAESSSVSSPPEEQPAVAKVEPAAAPVETVVEPKEEVLKADASATPLPETEQTVTVIPDSPEETSKDLEDSAATQEASSSTPSAEVEQPDKELPAPPSAFSLGGITRRLSSGVSGVFGYGTAVEDGTVNEPDETSAPSVDEPTPEGSATLKDDQEPEAEPIPVAAEVTEVATALEDAIPAPPVEEVRETKEDALVEVTHVNGEVVPSAQEEVEVRPTPKRVATSDKNLPSPPPPSAAESIAKIGKLTRRLSNRVSTRVGAAIRSSATSPKVESPSVEVEKQATAKVAPGNEGAEHAATSERTDGGGQAVAAALATSEGLNASSPATPNAGASNSPSGTTSTTPVAAPPGAFKSSKPKLGRRLSARIGDVFRSKAPAVPEKEAVKDDAKVSGEPSQTKGKPVSEVSADPAPKEDNSKEEEAKDVGPVDTESTPMVAEVDDSLKQGVKDNEPVPPAGEATQHEAAAPAPTTEVQTEDAPDKPLPSKPSRSSRARDAAVDVGRQLSIRASGALKATRPRLEEIVSRAPSAFKSSDKGKKREKDNVEDDWEEVEADGSLRSAGLVTESKPPVEDVAVDSIALTEGAPNLASSEDVKGASVEAVEGGTPEAVPNESTMPTTTAEPRKEDVSKAGRPALSSRVTGIFKAKQKPVEKPIHPAGTEAEDTQSNGATVNGKGEKRRRRISLGSRFGTKKSKKGGEVKGDAKEGSMSDISLPPPAVPPKDDEERDEKPLPQARDEATSTQLDDSTPAVSTQDKVQGPEVEQAAESASAPLVSA